MNVPLNMMATPVGPLNLAATVVCLVVVVAFGVGSKICMGSLTGRHLRKATPKELRWFSAIYLFLPIWLVSFAHIGHAYLDRAGAGGIWVYMMGCVFVGFLSLWFWVRFVSATVSWWLAGFVWVITLWLALAPMDLADGQGSRSPGNSCGRIVGVAKGLSRHGRGQSVADIEHRRRFQSAIAGAVVFWNCLCALLVAGHVSAGGGETRIE